MSELKQEFLKRSTTSIFISVVVISLILFSSNLILNIFISMIDDQLKHKEDDLIQI